jgi:Flp pilus assembly pilin Flp
MRTHLAAALAGAACNELSLAQHAMQYGTARDCSMRIAALTFLFIRTDESKMDRRSVFLLLIEDDSAQGLVEYALIIALVAMVSIAAMRILGKKINNVLTNAAKGLT